MALAAGPYHHGRAVDVDHDRSVVGLPHVAVSERLTVWLNVAVVGRAESLPDCITGILVERCDIVMIGAIHGDQQQILETGEG